jgi:recombination DNA repair RAD52 pathway protein
LPKRKRTQHSENLPFKSKKKRKIIYNNEENSNEIDGDDSAGEPNALNKSENKSMNEENIYHSSSSEDLAALLKKLDRKSYLSSKPLDQVDEFNNNIMVEGKKEL